MSWGHPGKGETQQEDSGYHGCAALISIAAVQCPEKEWLRGEGLFWLTSPGYTLSFWGSRDDRLLRLLVTSHAHLLACVQLHFPPLAQGTPRERCHPQWAGSSI